MDRAGADRGGFYSYDWLENLFGLQIHTADDIVEAWQDLAVGDFVAADRAGTGGWYVVELRPNEALALKVANLAAGRQLRRDEQLRWEFLWTFAQRPTASGGTRLLVRERVAFDCEATRLLMAPVGPVSFVMTRRMLLGVKARVEGPRPHRSPSAGPPEPFAPGTAPPNPAADQVERDRHGRARTLAGSSRLTTHPTARPAGSIVPASAVRTFSASAIDRPTPRSAGKSSFPIR